MARIAANPTPSASVGRLIAAALAACCVVLGIVSGPAAAASAKPGDASTLSGLTITSVSNGYDLDDQNGTPGAGSIIVTDTSPGYDESWHIGVPAADSSFTIVDDGTGLCIDAGLPLRQQPCDGRASENWYFQPVAGSSQNAFMIRQQGTSNCLDLLMGAWYSDAWTDSYGCNGTAAQQWTLPAAAHQAAWNLALDHATTACENAPSTCSWTTASQAPAAPLSKQCVSPVWYNNTSAPITWAFQINNTTGWSDTIGGSMGVELDPGGSLEGDGGGPAPVPGGKGTLTLQGKVTASVNGSVTNSISQTLGNTVTMPVPAGDYGWVALSELATQVTGDWTFDAQGFPWTAPDSITVPLTTDAAGGSSIYVAETNPTFTSCAA
ncbi:RICIN domain-containing protein [Streptacidiphilus melanogenes]|uniref:RICIN domain-containing protein n=1 Tax=Streptacidiphilus melanogenes TaxID=411235 RepID=UPI0005A61A82|nr:RICIN domain-containing protein [Streptacidiphilus melanogenes]